MEQRENTDIPEIYSTTLAGCPPEEATRSKAAEQATRRKPEAISEATSATQRCNLFFFLVSRSFPDQVSPKVFEVASN